jgi:hypothetical protein
MPAKKDKLLEAIEAVHAASLGEELWPDALGHATRLLGANCATLETVATSNLQHLEFRGFNIPPADQTLYLREYVELSPRTRFAVSRRAGNLIWDHQMMSEQAMDRDPFYQEFLRSVDLRYFYGGVIAHDGKEMTAVTFHRARTQGHVDRREIALMRRLLPHFRQAFGVMRAAPFGCRRRPPRRNWRPLSAPWRVCALAIRRRRSCMTFSSDARRTPRLISCPCAP